MPRLKLTIAYRGTRFHGWQTQTVPKNWKGVMPPEGEGLPTIQEILERTIREVANEPIHLVGSSRTDSGVHAKGQIAHMDIVNPNIPCEGLRRAINARIPGDILVKKIEVARDDFHAIKGTISKRYQYLIWNDEDRDVFQSGQMWHRWQKLDLDAMRLAAQELVGTHDFAAFAKAGHGRDSTVRTVLAVDITYRKPRLVIGVEGTGFLWMMVRIIVGTLVQVGLKRFTPADVKRMLETADRKIGGPTAPAHGLYLQWIKSREGGGDAPEGE